MRWVFYSVIALVTLVVIVPLAILAVVCAMAWPKLPDLDFLTDYQPRIPLRVYTADGFLIKKIGEERRAIVKIENVPNMLKQALVAAEDKRFYEHRGIDLSGVVRAALANLRGKRQGASTITMQVARNFYLSRERAFQRNLHQMLLPLKIERNLSKDQILELYINQIYLGQRSYGFETAARTYFGKSLGELTLAETAMLAGLPKGPSSLNPIVNPRGAKKRRRYVLERMRDLRFIDEDAYQAAIEEPLQIVPKDAGRDDPSDLSAVHAEYVAEMAHRIAVEKYGERATRIGLKLITTITRAEQAAANDALRQGVMDYDRRHGYRGPEKYISLPEGELDGGIINGELDEAREADERLRDYGDLLLAVVVDASPKEVTVFRNGEFIRIAGKGLSFASPMLKSDAPQARQLRRGALVRIRNGGGNKGWELTQMPEVDAALVSIDARTGAVRALVGGFDFSRNQFNNVTMARMCAPDIECPTSPWNMAATYAVFANDGYRVDPFMVMEIRDVNDKTLARFDTKTAGKDAPRVSDARNPRIMNSMLQKVGSRALNRKDIASKSGTSGDHTDAWFCGYNPAIVAVAWVGFPIPRNMGHGETGETAALPIWNDYMRSALADVPETSSPRQKASSRSRTRR
ncbi:MAG: transglycosylase domain-containing protein [Betaproteobacteria bacterium]|nr:transglycosylase domain-containing protein [Betaproteobacteria bacterium]